MSMPVFLPPSMRRTQKCERCGLWYAKKESQCTHCADLDDAGLARLQEQFARDHHSDARLGTHFLFMALLILVVLLGFFALAD